ncbi:MAG: hypothetical protein V1817_01400, partial [Candidatus Micrarchaeota archaeon]
MEIGASTIYGLTLKPAQAAARLARSGFKAIEVVDESPHFLTKENVAALRALKRDYDLSYSVHCPFMSMQHGH